MKSINLKFVFVFLLSIAMVLSISACAAKSDSDSDGTDSAATEAPAADATEAPAGDIVAAYVFTNTGSAEICELYLSPANTDNWGPDQLKGETIAVSGKFTITNVPAGSYDAKIVGCGGAGEATGVLDIHN